MSLTKNYSLTDGQYFLISQVLSAQEANTIAYMDKLKKCGSLVEAEICKTRLIECRAALAAIQKQHAV